MTGVHQFVPMLHRHDAVGGHTRAVRDRLVAAGVPSRIYTEIPDPHTATETRHYLEYDADAEAGDILVYQFATASRIAAWLAARPEPLVVNYHSVTPPEYFTSWNNGIARLQVDCLRELRDLAALAALGIAVSRFDEDELTGAGFADTRVIPVANLSDPPAEPDTRTLERLRDRNGPAGAAWLSVGRLVPNKAHHQTIAALFATRMSIDPRARLTLIGSPSEPNYAAALRRFAASLGMADAVDFLTGLDESELAAHYRSADVLVMLSDHEGFGVPLVEAMSQGLPVVAFGAGAVPEILGDAGVVLARKDPAHVASAIARLLSDEDERQRVISAGAARVDVLGLADAGTRMVEAVLGVSDRLETGGAEHAGTSG